MRRGFTLIELLVVVAVTATILGLVGQFFSTGWIGVRRAMTRTDNTQRIPILLRNWQQALGSTASTSWSIEGTVFKAGAMSARQDGNHLVLTAADRTRRILLPKGATVRFSVESPPELARCAVMDVKWTSPYFQAQKSNHVRLVACGRRDSSRE